MGNIIKSKLDANQVIRQAYDDDTGRLKVDAQVSASIGTVEVIIDAAGGDNIAITDATGTNYLEPNPDGSLTTTQALNNPTIQNITLTNAGTEYSFIIPMSTKRFEMRVRGSAKAQFSFTSGQSNVNFLTLNYGCLYSQDNLALTANLNVYIQANNNSQILEVLSWD